jgi:hypothetical protein
MSPRRQGEKAAPGAAFLFSIRVCLFSIRVCEKSS